MSATAVSENGRRKTHRTKVHYCVPTTDEGRKFKTELRGSDGGYLFIMDVPIAFVFPDSHIDETALKTALEKTLDVFPVAASRLVGYTLYGHFQFSCVKSRGARLEFETVSSSHASNGKLPTETDPAKSWNRFFVKTTFRPLWVPKRMPLLSARLTTFESGGCVLAVSFAHVLADGAAILHFMKTWSHLCGLEAGASVMLPAEMPLQPVLDRSIQEKKPSGMNVRHLRKEKYSNIRTLSTSVVLVTHMKTDEMADFRLSVEHVARIKQTLSAQLEKPKWISSYEAIMAVLLRALAMADRRKEMTCRAIVNIRGRTPLVPKEYFGNALSYHAFTFKNEGEISTTAFEFHESLRAGLEQVDDLNRPHFAGKHFISDGLIKSKTILEHVGFTKPFFDSVSRGDPVVNSWVGFDWFNIDFGLGGTAPRFLRVATSFRNHRHVHVYPSNAEGEMMVRMQLPRRTMEAFRRAVDALGFADCFVEVRG